jgi:hypothetical protein
MSNVIQIAGNAINSIPGGLFWHAQFVYGTVELEVQPLNDMWYVNRQLHSLTSNYQVEGYYDIVDLDIGSRVAANVWELLYQAGSSVSAAGIEYYRLSQNSNSFVFTLMQSLGLSLPRTLSGFSEAGGVDIRDQVTFNISGTGGEDWFFAGAQNDTLNGGGGKDTLDGGGGRDTINGGAGEDYLSGGGDVDTIHGGADNDVIDGGGDDDKLYGDGGNDMLYGDAGKDEIFGGDDNDNLYGQAGDDTLNGDDGDDQLYGGADKDELIGGVGADKLDGGEGTDTVSYAASEEAVRVNLHTGVGSGGDTAELRPHVNAWDDYLTLEVCILASRCHVSSVNLEIGF